MDVRKEPICLVVLLWLVSLWGGCTSTPETSDLYRQAEEHYQEGLEHRDALLREPELVLERFSKEVIPLWEEGLKVYPKHRALHRELGRLYLFLGEEHTQRWEKLIEDLTALQKRTDVQPGVVEALSRKAKVERERANLCLTQAIQHFRTLLELGESPSEVELLLGRAYLFLDKYDKALGYFRSALERGDLPPERQEQVREAIRLTYRLLRRE